MISDLVTSKEMDEHSVNADDWCSCINGALTKENYLNSIMEVGFTNIEVLNEKPYMDIGDNDNGRKISSLVAKATNDNQIIPVKMNHSSNDEPKGKIKKCVLFVCVENAGRSQMAEGLFRKYAPKDYEPTSAGTIPKSQINPLAVEAIREIGIDIGTQKPKELNEDMIKNADKIINMGCMDKNFCPTLFVPKVLDWGIEDPKGKPIEKVREIRDEIERKIKEMVERIGKGNTDN